MKRLILIVLGIVLVLNSPISAQQASQNIPVLPVIPESSGEADWYLRGDGYLQRQVEPTIAVSTRNPDHLLSFFVDYRAVNVPDDIGLGEETQAVALTLKTTNLMMAGLVSLPEIPFVESPPIAAAEAWVGGSASHDAGLTWTGFMMPGASFDDSLLSTESPVFGLEAATDPVAVAGPCGYVYVSFMAFTRGDQSKLVVARFQDLNDSESGKIWQYQGAWELESGNNAINGYFLDKPHINLDVFREESDVTAYSQHYPADEFQCGHRVYVSYSTFNGLDKLGKFQSKLNFATSVDRGETWAQSRIQQPYTQNQGSFIAVDPSPGEPTTTGGGSVYVVWRHFFSPDAIVMIKTKDYGKKFSKPIELTGDTPMATFDQPTLSAWDGVSPPSPDYLTARSNAFPTAAVTGDGTVFVAWQEKVDTNGQPDQSGSPRIVMVRSTTGGDSWTDINGNPGERVAVDIARRDDPLSTAPPAGFGALPDPRNSGPQVKPWLSFGGGKLALAYTEARGFLDGSLFGINQEDLSSATGFISGIDRVVDFRVALLDPATGQTDDSTQVSRYPISGSAILGDGEQVSDIAPVAPFLCAASPGSEYCQASLNLYNKNHSGAGKVPFMGDYPGMSPIVPMIYDGNSWRWANDPFDVPYQGFHVVFPDNRHLIPAVSPSSAEGFDEWERYPFYNFPPTDEYPDCINAGSRNTDVLTAKVNAGLVLSAPTTYKLGSPGDPTWGYPISVFNQSGEPRFYQLEINEDAREVASFVVDPLNPEFDGNEESNYLGVVQIFAYSSTSQMVYVQPGATQQIRIDVTQVQCDSNGENCFPVGGEQGFVTLNPDPSNPDVVASEQQNLVIVKEAVNTYEGDEAVNALNPFVKNPFVKNPFVKNTAIDDQTELYKVIDTTWSVQATEDSGAGSYLPVINIDNTEQFVGNYAFQLLIYKNASYGALEGCESLNTGNPVILSNVSQSPGDVQNPFVKNPFVKNPFVKNPFVKNPFVRNSAITVAPAEGVSQMTQSSAIQGGAKNMVFDNEGTLRVPRLPEKIFITLRAFQLKDDNELGDFVYNPNVDEPAISAVPTRCTTEDCIYSLAPNLVPTSFSGAPTAVAAGDSLTVSLSLENQGTVEAEAENRALRHGVYLSADATVAFGPGSDTPIDGDELVSYPDAGPETYPLFTPTDPPLNPGDSDTFEGVTLTISALPTGCAAGDNCYLIFVVDDYREVSENDETDNQMAVPVRINTPPTAADASFETSEDTPLTASLLDCDNPERACDADGDTLTFTLVTPPTSGTVAFSESISGQFTYTPDLDFNGTDSFTYSVDDGYASSEIATVTITVLPVADFAFEGFFSPWTEEPAYDANAGSAIPLKWRYRSVATGLVEDSSGFDPAITSTFYDKTASGMCPDYVEGEGVTDEITLDPDDPGSSDLRYSPSSNEWQLNWATPEAAGCYYLRVSHQAEPGEVSRPLLIILD